MGQVRLKGWIMCRKLEQPFLEEMGVEVGKFNKKLSQFEDCIVTDEVLDKLDPFWGRLVWGLIPIEDEEKEEDV